MPSDSASFDALIGEFYQVWCRFRPVATTSAGVGCCQGRLPVAADDEFGALQSWLEKLLLGLEELDYSSLDEARKIDLELVFGAARIEYHDLLEHDWRHRDPVRFLPLLSLMPYLESQAENFNQALEAMLKDVPEKLRLARGHLKVLPELISPVVVVTAIEQADASFHCLQHINSRHSEDDASLDSRLADAMEAINHYSRFLSDLSLTMDANASRGCGSVHFLRLLRYRHFSSVSLEKLHQTTQAWFDAAMTDFMQLSQGRTPQDVANTCKQMPCLTPEGAVAFCREENLRLHDFIDAAELFTLPDAPLSVTTQSHCAIDAAGYTPGVLWLDERPATELELQNRCLNFAWSGRHLQLNVQRDQTQCLPRQLHASVAQQKAWDLVVRDSLGELNYFSDDGALYQSLLQLQTLKLALIDMAIHLDNLPEQEGVNELFALGFTQDEAMRSLSTIVRNPSDALYSVIGHRLLAALSAEVVGDSSHTKKHLNDSLLAQGMLPTALLIRAGFGEDVLKKIEQGLFA